MPTDHHGDAMTTTAPATPRTAGMHAGIVPDTGMDTGKFFNLTIMYEL